MSWYYYYSPTATSARSTFYIAVTQTNATTTTTMPSQLMWIPRRTYVQDTPYYHNACNPAAAQQRLFEQERARQAIMFDGHAEAASALADGLLMEHLTPEQRDCFQRNKWFVVEGGKSKHKYRIRAKDNLVANIDVLHGPGYGEGVSHRLCAHADPKAMPLGDHLLAQKMMIEYAEENFLKIANRHNAYG